MIRKLMIGLLALGLLLTVTACPSGEAHTTIPTAELPIADFPPPGTVANGAPDDILAAPGGIIYRANIHEEGEENPWPPIKITNVTLSSWFRELTVGYRDYIETRAGETRNNIFMVGRDNGRLNLYATQFPLGLELTQTIIAGRVLFAVLVIRVAPEVAPGKYNFDIGLEINGGDYGTVPCTIEVIVNTISGDQGITSINIQPEPDSYLHNAFDEPSGVILKGVQVEADICDKEYFSPWYPSRTVKKGDPCLVVSGHIQNMHRENSEIAMYAEGYDTSGEQVAWTLDADHISGQIGLHLEYEETGEFTLHLNLSENTSTIRIYANNYSVTPP